MSRQRKRKGDPVHGWLILDKPVDMTSTQAVGLTKRLLNAQKAGHGGTLDPLADGILPIAFGEATKTAAFAMDADKDYRFTIRWGTSTSTQDMEGDVVAESDVRPSRSEIEAVLPGFVGEIDQVPPKYSAIKVDGERAYDLARDGEAFDLPSRKVEVFSLSLAEYPSEDEAVFEVNCGKGFYVRALVRDIASALGAEGHVCQLRRTRVGALDEARSVTPADLEALDDADACRAHLRPMQDLLDDLPHVDIDDDQAAQLKQGRTITLMPHILDQWKIDHERLELAGDDRVSLAVHGDNAAALGEVRAGRFQPSRVFQI